MENTSSNSFSKFTFTLLKHYRTLEAHLPEDFFINTWSEYFYTLDNDVISILTRTATIDDYSEMIDILLANTVSFIFRNSVILSRCDHMYYDYFSVG